MFCFIYFLDLIQDRVHDQGHTDIDGHREAEVVQEAASGQEMEEVVLHHRGKIARQKIVKKVAVCRMMTGKLRRIVEIKRAGHQKEEGRRERIAADHLLTKQRMENRVPIWCWW